jgi:uncharacterized membrane protein HdeD (DUF308 family)
MHWEADMATGMPMGTETLRKYRTWFMLYGALLVLLGLAAVALPNIATLATGFLVGWLLLAAGAFGLVAVFSAGREASGFWWNLFTSVIYVLAGLALLFRPVAGILTLTILLAAYLVAGGIAKLIMAFGYKNEIPRAWGWVLFSGLVDLVLAFIIMSGFPGTATWVIGLMVGINLLMMGVSLIVAAYHCGAAPAPSVSSSA